GARIGADGAAVLEVEQDGERVGDDLVRLAALDVGDEADAARILVERRVVQPARRRDARIGGGGPRHPGPRRARVATLPDGSRGGGGGSRLAGAVAVLAALSRAPPHPRLALAVAVPLTPPPRPLRLPALRCETEFLKSCRAAVPRRSGVCCVAARSAPPMQSAS